VSRGDHAADASNGSPLARKLGVRPGMVLALLAAPADFDALLAPLPGGVTVRRHARGSSDLIVAFFVLGNDLARRLPVLARALQYDGGLWIAWPKRASGTPTDLSDDAVRGLGLAAGLVDNKVCAIDETWSGLRFVYRVADRPAGGAGRSAAGIRRA
jgi:hypothetical protein